MHVPQGDQPEWRMCVVERAWGQVAVLLNRMSGVSR